MNHRFALPAALALALLGELFFGFPAQSAPAPAAREPKDATSVDVFPVSQEPETPEPDQAERRAADARNRPPDLEDLPVLPRPGDFEARPALEPTPSPRTALTIDTELARLAGDGPGKGDGYGASIVDATMLDRVPHARVQSPPAYPAAARMAGLGGEVVVEFVVTADGRVTSPRAVRSSDPAFEEPTLRAVLKWRFEPGLMGGRPISFRMIVPVVFRVGG